MRLIVGFAPGGSTDTAARVVAQAIAASLGQPVVVENRTGAAGNLATEHVARSAPDGHTLVVASLGSHATNAALYSDLPFDVVRDFAPVTLISLSACLLAVHPSVQARNVAELIALAKARPGALNCGIAGAGSSQHFAAVLFEQQADVRFTHVSYRGGAPAMTDLISGQIDVMFSPTAEVLQQLQAGQVRGLGVTRQDRSPRLPDMPAIAETLPGYQFNSWLGLFAPAGTPAPAIRRISDEVAAAMRRPEVRAQMEQFGYQPVGSTSEEFATFYAGELPRVKELVRISGATVN
ncbi:Bug family tripartite tricarboxylate transporter substrate binding protein [Teichococcus vastitatis]|uniref:Tripartite tricarboxylate transporter substrate binding protein n=1 Tax=Teichococcus vastitatis TaxID=2307076 RepID=A0ABS9W694_9PROT|nr:tripartite tricarboxylate transporter substrate binding protein [Pseudoroseomonas vastitatis]